MTHAQERAIARVCAHECLQRELVEALESVTTHLVGILRDQCAGLTSEFDAVRNARAVLARAKEQS